MFIQRHEHSLNEYGDLYELTDLEMEVIKTYMSMDENTRRTMLKEFSKLFFTYNKSDKLESIYS